MRLLFEYATLALLFFLPWQTVWIFQQGKIGAPDTPFEGLWQYGTLGIYFWDIIAVFCIVVFLLALRRNDRGLFFSFQKNKKIILFAGCAVIVTAATVFWSYERAVALYYTIRLVEGFLLFTLAQLSQVGWKKIATTLIVAGSIQAVLAVVQFFMQEIPANTLFGMSYHSAQVPGDIVVQTFDARWLRAYGSFPHPNILAYFLGIAFLCSVTLVGQVEKKVELVGLSAALILLLIGIFFTFSREVALGLIVVFLLSFLWKKRRSFKQNVYEGISPSVLLFVVSSVTLALLSSIYYEPLFARLGIGGLERLERKSLDERVSSLQQGWEIIQRLPQGAGIGNMTYAAYFQDIENGIKKPWYIYQPVHSQYLLIATEVGIVGLFVVILFFTAAAWNLFVKTKVSDALFLQQRIFLFTFIIGIFDHFFWTIPVGIAMWWMVIGFCVRCPEKPLDS